MFQEAFAQRVLFDSATEFELFHLPELNHLTCVSHLRLQLSLLLLKGASHMLEELVVEMSSINMQVCIFIIVSNLLLCKKAVQVLIILVVNSEETGEVTRVFDGNDLLPVRKVLERW